MPDLLGVLASVLLLGSSGALSAGPETLDKAMCEGPDMPGRPEAITPPGDSALLVGRYICDTEDARIVLLLQRDGSFRLDIGPAAQDEAPSETVTGRWVLEGGTIHATIMGSDGIEKHISFHPIDPAGRIIVIPAGLGAAVLRRVTP